METIGMIGLYCILFGDIMCLGSMSRVQTFSVDLPFHGVLWVYGRHVRIREQAYDEGIMGRSGSG